MELKVIGRETRRGAKFCLAGPTHRRFKKKKLLNLKLGEWAHTHVSQPFVLNRCHCVYLHRVCYPERRTPASRYPAGDPYSRMANLQQGPAQRATASDLRSTWIHSVPSPSSPSLLHCKRTSARQHTCMYMFLICVELPFVPRFLHSKKKNGFFPGLMVKTRIQVMLKETLR